MRAYDFVEFEKTHVVLATKADAPDRIRRVDLSLKCSDHPVVAHFVTKDGELIFIDEGKSIEYSGPAPAGFNCIDVTGKKGTILTYHVQLHGPRRAFERTDPTPPDRDWETGWSRT